MDRPTQKGHELAGKCRTPRRLVLEFSANVNGKALKGIDLIQFDAQGLITEFEVMVRPLSGLQALGAEMGARLAAHLPAHKMKG